MGQAAASPGRIAAAQQAAKALELRKAGATYESIAERLGYHSRQAAHRAVASALKRTLREPADDLRHLEEQRLDAMLLAIWSQVRRGNLGALDRAVRIGERRAKLLGLDMPTKQELSGPGGGPIEVDHAGLDDEGRITRLVALFESARARRDRQADSASPAMGAIAGPPDSSLPE